MQVHVVEILILNIFRQSLPFGLRTRVAISDLYAQRLPRIRAARCAEISSGVNRGTERTDRTILDDIYILRQYRRGVGTLNALVNWLVSASPPSRLISAPW